MKISFYGAAQEVTGSMHLIEVNDRRILLDCGLYQGRRKDTYERNLNFGFDPKSIDALVLSHAHIDHSGNIPNLIKQGFTGNVWCTSATRNLCTYMLMDSGYIQEQDIKYLNEKKRRKGEPPVEPIYTRADAQKCLDHFIGVGLHRTFSVADGVEVTFYDAGHILGATFVQLDIREQETGKKWRVVFSGDLGRDEVAILHAPEQAADADIVLMESTYGNRQHGEYEEARKKLRNVINTTARKRGKVIIPSFSVGRTQEIVYALNRLDAEGDIPEIPVFVDSPLAVNATDVFRMHPEEWNDQVQEFLVEGRRRNPFDYHQVQYVRAVEQSKRLNFMSGPAVIISASGMAESGRILHHLKNNIEDPDNTILTVSYMAEHTLGRRIRDGVSPVRIFGEEYTIRAQVEAIDGYSAHADQMGLLEWARAFDRKRLQQVFLVHGEPEPAETLAGKLREEDVGKVTVPVRGQQFTF
ncbi:MBL fold metallo-hydrolase [Chloroflexi bacterium TSY]|nr:MBL fold metallo-hydrolase [Chloroflexi bacterium TSY]